MNNWVYLNGKFVRKEEALMPIDTTGALRAYGIFDFLRIRNGKPTFLEDHLNRFDRSQKFLELSKLISKEEIRNVVHELQKLNNWQ